jgi:aspartate aminotransferase
MRFFTESAWARRAGEPGICDFSIGNPHEMPARAFVEALQSRVVPHDANWYGYKLNEPSSRAVVAEALRRRRGMAFEPEDIFLTNGATAALAVVLGAIVDPGDEVIFISPPWFQYEAMIVIAGGVPVRVRADPGTFDLDLEAVARAAGGKTRAVIINSPHNPTGRIYPPETLAGLARILAEAGRRSGRTIYLISDEAYSRILFDNRTYHSPTAYYPDSFLVYTYAKVLLTPGQRIGFIALPPDMPGREQIRPAILAWQMLNGWAFPNALLQHALADLEQIPPDMDGLQRKRDRMVGALRDLGYAVYPPEGTFYVLARSPQSDDYAFCETLAEQGVFCIPGTALELPGYFRISLTASSDMIERSLPGFASAMRRAREGR